MHNPEITSSAWFRVRGVPSCAHVPSCLPSYPVQWKMNRYINAAAFCLTGITP
ncbi:MAG: hypothetical protein H6Q57_2056 [Geobacteraceae bacterium]|jgi:hypothetical protein|nr:hypothetical protein [Geobacteraceae bacterium]